MGRQIDDAIMLQPGESRSFRIHWGACRCDGPIADVQPGGCASQKLTAQAAGQGVRLTGVFGVFDRGNLLLSWLDKTGEAIGSVFLEEVDPQSPVRFDQTLVPPPGAQTVELCVLAQADGQTRRLAAISL